MRFSATALTTHELTALHISFLEQYQKGDLRDKDLRFFSWFMGLTSEERDFLIEDTETPNITLEAERPFLQRISGDQEILISATDGTGLVRDTKYNVTHVENKRLRVNQSDARPSVRLRVYQVIRGGHIWEMLRSLGVKKSKLALTQHQFIMFCEEHPELIEERGQAFFLIFDQTEMYIFEVSKIGKELGIRSYEPYHVNPDPKHRVIVLEVLS